MQELKDEHMKTGETLSLWQEYAHLSNQCSLHLQELWRQWEELARATPQRDAQAVVHSVEVSSGSFQQNLNMQTQQK